MRHACVTAVVLALLNACADDDHAATPHIHHTRALDDAGSLADPTSADNASPTAAPPGLDAAAPMQQAVDDAMRLTDVAAPDPAELKDAATPSASAPDAAIATDAQPAAAEPPEDLASLVQHRLVAADCSTWWADAYFEQVQPLLIGNDDLVADCAGRLGLLNLESGAFEPLVEYAGTLATFRVTSKHLLYIDAEGLKSVSLEGGAAKLLAAKANAGGLKITSDGRYVVYVGANNEPFAVPVDGSAEPWGMSPPASPTAVSVQPYGTRVVYVGADGTLLSHDLVTRQTVVLGPYTWSASDRELRRWAWIDAATHRLWTMNVDGSDKHEWSELDLESLSVEGFTPDGETLVVRHDKVQLSALSVSTRSLRPLAAPCAGQKLWHRDITSSAVIYQIDHRRPMAPFADWFEICAVPLDGRPMQPLGRQQGYLSDGYVEGGASFSQDQTQLIFADDTRGRAVVDLETFHTETIAAQVGPTFKILEAPQGFSPDDSHVYFNAYDGEPSHGFVQIVDLKGEHPITIKEADVTESVALRFSPDSQYVVIPMFASTTMTLVHIARGSMLELPTLENHHYAWIDAHRLLVEREGLHIVRVP